MSGSPLPSDPEPEDGEGVRLDKIRGEFATADLDRHLALFYRDRAEQLAVASAFVEHGLRRDRRCLYLADDNDPDAVRAAFESAGIDVDERAERGDLDVVDAADLYLDDGFDPDRMVEALEREAERCVADGYAGLYAAGENTWTFGVDGTFDRILEFEADFDRCCPEFPATAMCQYDVARFSDEAIGKALQTHEQIVYDGSVIGNPYYVSPEEYLGSGGAKSNRDLLLDQTRDIALFRRDVERREQRLSVVNRVLRHNIRNDLNVVLGRIEWLLERGDVDAETRDHLDIARSVSEGLVDLAERARHVDRTLETTDRRWIDLDRRVEDIAAGIERNHDAVAVAVTDATERRIVAEASVGAALEELLVIAATHHGGDAVDLSVRLAPGDTSGMVHLVVGSDREILPEVDRAAATEAIEEAHRHGTGLSVWVVRWLLEQSNGRLSLPEEGPLTEVTITVPVVARPIE